MQYTLSSSFPFSDNVVNSLIMDKNDHFMRTPIMSLLLVFSLGAVAQEEESLQTYLLTHG